MAVRPFLAGAIAGLTLLAAACGGDDDAGSSATTAATEASAASAPETNAAAPTTDGSTASTESDGTGPTGDDVPMRIVSLSPTHTETLFAIGAGPQVIAVDDQSNYPPEAAAVQTELSGYTPNVEAIAGYEPDLVVTSGDDTLTGQLEAIGLTVWAGESATTFDEAYTQIEQLGAATGHVGEAAELVAQMQTDLDGLVASLPTSEVPLTVYHELSADGYSASSATFIGQVYELFGLRNIADAAEDISGYPQLNAETIITADPDLIFLADTKCCGESIDTVSARDGWDQITAVQNGHVFAMDDDIASRWGPRVVEYAQQVHDAVEQALAPAG
ncbi:MAG TPA: ABC transporter substrate-binding protein [Ilumatobacteraceae bacterium]|nr:ABC transporter substrate-binding protein [Ilumatobacteraceae bacterium]